MTRLAASRQDPWARLLFVGMVHEALPRRRVIGYECETDNVTAPATFSQTVMASGDPPTWPSITSLGSTATAQVASSRRGPP